jgi:hypothetical protein
MLNNVSFAVCAAIVIGLVAGKVVPFPPDYMEQTCYVALALSGLQGLFFVGRCLGACTPHAPLGADSPMFNK